MTTNEKMADLLEKVNVERYLLIKNGLDLVRCDECKPYFDYLSSRSDEAYQSGLIGVMRQEILRLALYLKMRKK